MLWGSNENRRYSTTNLARTGAADQDKLSNRIIETWVRYLLDHQSDLSAGFMVGIKPKVEPGRYARFPRQCTWLEDYSALTLYNLARNAWHFTKGDALDKWEMCSGSIDPSTGSELCDRLLWLVLPRVASGRSFSIDDRIQLLPPVSNWKEVLESCRDFVSKPVPWSRFVAFTGITEDSLYDTSSGLLNQKYQSRLATFSDAELNDASAVFQTLLRSLSTRTAARLTDNSASLLRRLIETAGDLTISDYSDEDEMEVHLKSFRSAIE
jgi:hypothetical protein